MVQKVCEENSKQNHIVVIRNDKNKPLKDLEGIVNEINRKFVIFGKELAGNIPASSHQILII